MAMMLTANKNDDNKGSSSTLSDANADWYPDTGHCRMSLPLPSHSCKPFVFTPLASRSHSPLRPHAAAGPAATSSSLSRSLLPAAANLPHSKDSLIKLLNKELGRLRDRKEQLRGSLSPYLHQVCSANIACEKRRKRRCNRRPRRQKKKKQKTLGSRNKTHLGRRDPRKLFFRREELTGGALTAASTALRESQEHKRVSRSVGTFWGLPDRVAEKREQKACLFHIGHRYLDCGSH
ncbi:hypothetical protein EJ110_NYTH54023 [Nymphaea thermarum]|nr:hypothetical protein EJ110_NYTH54023 [Nymphaea thermarum]